LKRALGTWRIWLSRPNIIWTKYNLKILVPFQSRQYKHFLRFSSSVNGKKLPISIKSLRDLHKLIRILYSKMDIIYVVLCLDVWMCTWRADSSHDGCEFFWSSCVVNNFNSIQLKILDMCRDTLNRTFGWFWNVAGNGEMQVEHIREEVGKVVRCEYWI
jgi:hypothetical protein